MNITHKEQSLARLTETLETLVDSIFEWDSTPEEVKAQHAQLTYTVMDKVEDAYLTDLLVRYLPVAAIEWMDDPIDSDYKTPEQWIGKRIADMVQDEITSIDPLYTRPLAQDIRVCLRAGMSVAQVAAKHGGTVQRLEAFMDRHNALAETPVPETWDSVYTRIEGLQWHRMTQLINGEVAFTADGLIAFDDTDADVAL